MTPQLAVKMAVAASAGLAVAQALRLPYPEYAVLAAGTVTDVRAGPSAMLGVLRMVGTIVGGMGGRSAAHHRGWRRRR